MKPLQVANAQDLASRFAVALEQVQSKPVTLVASAPLLLAIAIVAVSAWLARVISRRVHVITHLRPGNPHMEGLLRGCR